MLADLLQTLFACRLGLALLLGLGCGAPQPSHAAPPPDARRPNVLFVVIDDMNDAIALLDPANPIKTPNLERLARRGVVFTRAYCASPACNPSRVAVLTGKRPSTTGVYGNKGAWRETMPDAVTLMQHFMSHGYRVEGAGKIFHHHLGGAFHDKGSFHRFLMMPDPPDKPMPAAKLNGFAWYGSPNTDWGVWPAASGTPVDVRTIDFCIERLREIDTGDRPFFLAAGLFRPHMPFFAPQQAFAHYPIDDVVMPETKDGDLDDLPTGALTLLGPKAWFFDGMMKADRQSPGAYRAAVQAYQACSTFADAQLGRLLDALDASPQRDNTVIVLWSDHGYHLGEKRHMEKFALWEKTTRVPYIVAAPGLAPGGGRCDRPVDLMSIYPTLIELCGLERRPDLDGVSVVPLLKDPDGASWDRPALMTYKRNNHAVRSDRWRYIRYADATEELYDHNVDPHEWNNVAADPSNKATVDGHRQWLPEVNAAPTKPLGRKR
ncbi:MAG: sulfatase [Planctomycetota bacterium]